MPGLDEEEDANERHGIKACGDEIGLQGQLDLWREDFTTDEVEQRDFYLADYGHVRRR